MKETPLSPIEKTFGAEGVRAIEGKDRLFDVGDIVCVAGGHWTDHRLSVGKIVEYAGKDYLSREDGLFNRLRKRCIEHQYVVDTSGEDGGGDPRFFHHTLRESCLMHPSCVGVSPVPTAPNVSEI